MSANELDTLLKALQSGTPVQRRTAAYQLGKMQNPLIIPELIAAADDSDKGVRSFLASALATIGDPAIEKLTIALSDDSEYVQQVARLALQHMKTPAATAALQQHTGENNDDS
ncbi:MAG: HEAT repeat domain-containing protein, partial [Chloroflexota bacterium]